MSDFEDQDTLRFRNRMRNITIKSRMNIQGTVTGRITNTGIPNLQELPKTDTQKASIQRLRKSKQISRAAETQFYGYCIGNVQLG